MKKVLSFLLIMFVSIAYSNKKDIEIKPEIRQGIENQIKMDLGEFLLGNIEENYTDPNIQVIDISEEQFSFKGDLYGTYQVRFEYSFNDGDSKIKGSGIAVFSYDGSQSIVYGDQGIFVDDITVDGVKQDAKKSKYSLYIREWD